VSTALLLALLLPPLLAQEPAPAEPPTARAGTLAALRLPVLTDRMRDQAFDEAELQALLETSMGSGVSMTSLVGALEVVVSELEQGVSMPNLAVRLPAWIAQGLRGEELAAVLRGSAPAAEGATEPEPVSAE
jgi:hypothetical protein